MQRGTRTFTSLEKYRAVPRPKVPVEDDEIRVSMAGRMPRYVQYAVGLLTEKGKKRITIKATGNAIAGAITLAENIKRRFENVHQQNIIGTTISVDTYEPVEYGLDQVTYERNVPFIEIILSLNPSLLDETAVGYQPPIDQSCVAAFDSSNATLESGMRGGRRGGYRGGYGRGGMRRGAPRQYAPREQESTNENQRRGGRTARSMPPRRGYRPRGRRYRGNYYKQEN